MRLEAARPLWIQICAMIHLYLVIEIGVSHVWKDIVGFEGVYEISGSGIIRSKDRVCVDSMGRRRFRKGQVLNPDVAPNGYYRVTLAKNGRKVQKYLHRLLASHFIPNPDNLPQVNHKDGNKLNCSLDNLEWVTVKDNVIHAYQNGLIHHIEGKAHPNYGKRGSMSKRAVRVKATSVMTGESKVYGSMVEAKTDGFLPSEVSRCTRHGGTHHGFVFTAV